MGENHRGVQVKKLLISASSIRSSLKNPPNLGELISTYYRIEHCGRALDQGCQELIHSP